ncbi:Uncharacterized membrane protein YcaP, DUF421 family [Seinonella peptonophila]|uniref:Uncharacterized membrane protein YcaP, DUF421 family n=1 Tax=Seinonella peptonophila TaxID=112248 RepID=A0A1M4TR66_9BACL|nr:DUF421 domain-containing protein [Seinonella peptonophila]SHE46953.1 Uncharacterized membrane protein YcaP, DUF421 family [Seinonella peptonophila]
MELWSFFWRTILIYIFMFFVVRLMGKREVGKLSVFDMVVSFMIAGISAIALESHDRPLLHVVVPISTLVGLQILISYISLRFSHIRHFIEGQPIVIIQKGKLQVEEMRKNRYNLDDLRMQLREKEIVDISEVEYAFLETSGKLSVFPKYQALRDKSSQVQFPNTLIIEGKIQEEHLHKLNQDRHWLLKQLQAKGYQDWENIYYASYTDNDGLFIIPNASTSKSGSS